MLKQASIVSYKLTSERNKIHKLIMIVLLCNVYDCYEVGLCNDCL